MSQHLQAELLRKIEVKKAAAILRNLQTTPTTMKTFNPTMIAAEKSRADLATANAEISTLKSENARLKTQLAAASNKAPTAPAPAKATAPAPSRELTGAQRVSAAFKAQADAQKKP